MVERPSLSPEVKNVQTVSDFYLFSSWQPHLALHFVCVPKSQTIPLKSFLKYEARVREIKTNSRSMSCEISSFFFSPCPRNLSNMILFGSTQHFSTSSANFLSSFWVSFSKLMELLFFGIDSEAACRISLCFFQILQNVWNRKKHSCCFHKNITQSHKTSQVTPLTCTFGGQKWYQWQCLKKLL